MAASKVMRCRTCMWYNYNFISDCYEKGSFCGLHGCAHVVPGGPQQSFLHTKEPDCGYHSKVVQLTLDF